jgi:hypothetical protein
VPSTALASPGYDGQPVVYLYIAALEVNALNFRGQGLQPFHRAEPAFAYGLGDAGDEVAADLINVTQERRPEASMGLPAFSTLDELATGIRSEVSAAATAGSAP